MLRVFRGEECALVMVEPPGDLGIGRVLEIDDGVLVASEQAVVEKLRGFVGEARVHELRIRVEGPFKEAAEKGCRRRAVETVVVIEDSYPHAVGENLTACLNTIENAIGENAGALQQGRDHTEATV